MSETQEGEVVDGTEVEVYHPPTTPSLFRTDDPVEVIEKATRVADALKAVVANRGLIAKISGREHPRVEAWQTLGSMLGVFPVKEWVRAVPWPDTVPDSLKGVHEQGKAFGYEASFFAQRADGTIVGGGEAACMRSEKTWSGRDDFALRSMAQTRATSKALKAPLGFVMSLAGYETTPAEEMFHETSVSHEPPAQSAGLSQAKMAEVLAAISRAKMPGEWYRLQLIEAGVQNVPEGQIMQSTIKALTPAQAESVIAACNDVTEAREKATA